MNSDKKLTIKRLVIYLLFTLVPWIAVPILCAYYGEPIFASESEDVAVATYILGVFGMLAPSCAHLLTRIITKEGFHNTYLGVSFKGKIRYWIASVAVKLIEGAVAAVLLCALFIDGRSLSEAFGPLNLRSIGILLIQLAFSVIVFFPAFGEEWGWRGYMMPKLCELMPKPAAIIVGGVIWGLWHAPLTVVGHNFGVDYPGFPWVGILLMCVMCTFMNAFLTLLTERTGSIYPAAFCHAVNNNLNVAVLISIFGTEGTIEQLTKLSSLTTFTPVISLIAITGTVSFILLMRKKPA